MKRKICLLLAFCLILSLSACGVPQEAYEILYEENKALQAQVEELKTEVERLTAQNNTLETQIKTFQSETESLPPVSESESESKSQSQTSSALDEYIQSKKDTAGPSELELMTYAQAVIDDFYPNPKYSRDQGDYTFTKTNLRHKIEGEVSTDSKSRYEKFHLIIQFVDEKYEEYDVLSLQIGDEVIYKNSNIDATVAAPSAKKDPILNEDNTKIYNAVMKKLDTEYDRDEDEILEEMAPSYGMTVDELRQFIFDYMDAYYK